jgi:hypothetical protein
MTPTLLTVVLASAIAAPAPDEEIKLPTGAQPLQVLAKLNKDGRIEITEMLAVYTEEKRVRTVNVGGIPRAEEYIVTTMRSMPRTRLLPEKGVKVYTAAGKEVDPKDWPEKLRKPAVIFMAWDGKKVDPFYLRVAKADTLVIVPPQEPPRPIDDGAKPAPKPEDKPPPKPPEDKPPEDGAKPRPKD